MRELYHGLERSPQSAREHATRAGAVGASRHQNRSVYNGENEQKKTQKQAYARLRTPLMQNHVKNKMRLAARFANIFRTRGREPGACGRRLQSSGSSI